MHIEYRTKNVYGNDNRYIVNPDIAQAVRTLTGKKTINTGDIFALSTLGHTFEEVK